LSPNYPISSAQPFMVQWTGQATTFVPTMCPVKPQQTRQQSYEPPYLPYTEQSYKSTASPAQHVGLGIPSNPLLWNNLPTQPTVQSYIHCLLRPWPPTTLPILAHQPRFPAPWTHQVPINSYEFNLYKSCTGGGSHWLLHTLFCLNKTL
jgi:hypothetical protein